MQRQGQADGSTDIAVAASLQQELYSGPIPHPDIIRGYEELVPGAAERILAMAEKQSEHRQEMERNIINAEIRDSHLGMLFGFSIGLLCLIVSALAILFSPSNAGAIIGGVLGATGLGSIVGVFIKATRISSKSDNE